jgi:heme/copper-type cytochrome/quinol oxidase subunit 2
MKKLLLLIGSILFCIGNVYAQGTCATLDCVANGLMPQVAEIINTLGGLSYIFGIVFGIKAAFKLKEHSESKGQVKLNVPIIMLVAAVFFLALPSLLHMGIDTLSLSTPSTSNLGSY